MRAHTARPHSRGTEYALGSARSHDRRTRATGHVHAAQSAKRAPGSKTSKSPPSTHAATNASGHMHQRLGYTHGRRQRDAHAQARTMSTTAAGTRTHARARVPVHALHITAAELTCGTGTAAARGRADCSARGAAAARGWVGGWVVVVVGVSGRSKGQWHAGGRGADACRHVPPRRSPPRRNQHPLDNRGVALVRTCAHTATA